MKDIDFDELDKAVNSLMSNVGKETLPEKTEDDDVRTVTIPSTLDTGTDVTPKEPATPVVTSDAETHPGADMEAKPASSPVSTSAAARRGGRFMDVVHPSSDMKTATAPVKSISRQGVTVTPSATAPPLTPSVPPEDQAPAIEAPVVLEPSASAPPAVAEHHSDWPDPIDLHEAKQAASTPVESTAPAEPVEMPAPTNDAPTESKEPEVAEPAPLTSPFLADAKVEKRPLGAPTPLSENAQPETIPEPVKDDADAAQIGAEVKAEELVRPLPPELQGDLVAIESADTGTTHEAAATPAKESKPKEDKDKPETVSKPVTATGPTSISQQYKEEPSTGDQESGAIYDTDTYHKPLAHPAKKKSGWMLVIWIIIILALGAGGGAAVYFLGLV